MAPRNRKERRAAQASASSDDSFDPASIPLSRPPASSTSQRPKAKTLYELAAEREAELAGASLTKSTKTSSGTEFVTLSPSGELLRVGPSGSSTSSMGAEDNSTSSDGNTDEDATIPPLPDTILLSLPLSALHFTLSFLAAHQYAQEIPLRILIRESAFISFPALTILIYIAHGHIIPFGKFDFRSKEKRNGNPNTRIPTNKGNPLLDAINFFFPPSPKTVVFLPVAALLGARLIAMTNEASYYAVMKRAPAVGTLWVWSVLELSLVPALFGVLLPIGWAIMCKGYGIV
ncbi:hypothetical protein AJ79_08650 [Helicocarpus griseus UAMH5409]|uniref:DUF7719 domain-containing protein n=1 Tax=Helicocarpus griseus UAMH5409 TaxID=1447875 RepID=A0A2B7WRV0_9EURO|nr:hypothetical protein AJ79_08650 [Helicocarpus griseus UAMH5409]